MADFAERSLGQVALAMGVLDQEDLLGGAYVSPLASAYRLWMRMSGPDKERCTGKFCEAGTGFWCRVSG